MARKPKFDPGLALSLVLVVATGSTVGAVLAATQETAETTLRASPAISTAPQMDSRSQPQFRIHSRARRPLGLSRGS